MSTDPGGSAAAHAPARLLIHAHAHAQAQAAGATRGAFARALLWLSQHAGQVPLPRAPLGTARVQIDDLLGQRFFSAEQTEPVIDVPLPAGTYHVTVQLGSSHRRYTVTLEHGASLHLHLRSATDRG